MLKYTGLWVLSSVVERFVHIEEAVGPNPTVPTMQEILKQSSWLFSAQILARGVGFFYTLYIARSLSVADFGLYSLALSYFSIIGAISEFGLNRYLIREVAKENSNLFNLLFNVAAIRLILTILVITTISLLMFMFDKDNVRNTVILLVMFATVPQALSLTIDSIFVGLQKLQFSCRIFWHGCCYV